MGEELKMIRTRTEEAHGRMGQDEDTEQEHRTVWGDIRKALELAQKREGEATVTTLKSQVSKIEYFAKKMEFEVWASISRIKELTYIFSQLRQQIKHLENLEK